MGQGGRPAPFKTCAADPDKTTRTIHLLCKYIRKYICEYIHVSGSPLVMDQAASLKILAWCHWVPLRTRGSFTVACACCCSLRRRCWLVPMVLLLLVVLFVLPLVVLLEVLLELGAVELSRPDSCMRVS